MSATNLYAARVITLGTLISVYLTTSDEMLPILISSAAPISLIIKILLIKLIIGIVFGVIIDIIFISNLSTSSCNCKKWCILSSLVVVFISIWMFGMYYY